MGRLRCLIILSILVLPLCSPNVSYYIDISPKTDSDIYEMNIGSTAAFRVEGFQKDEQTAEVLPVAIERAWWDFNKDILVKTVPGKDTITLRAINTGTSKLSVNAMLINRSYSKAITILVKGIK